MRKLVAGLFVTLDGVVEAPEEWNPPYFDEEMAASVWSMVDAADTTLFRPEELPAVRKCLCRQEEQ